ncbi:unnamed protein product [Brassica rapa subsp. narinosa]
MPPVTKRPAGRRKTKRFLSTGEIPVSCFFSHVDMCGRDQIRRRYRTSVEDAGGQGITGRTVRFR